MRGKPASSNRARLGALAALLAVTVIGTTAAFAQAPATVGVFEPLSLGSRHPYLAARAGDAWETAVHFDGATYVRIHFSQFDLAPGDYVEISRPDGGELTRYTGRGPHGTGEFWAFAVLGETAVLRMQSSTGGAPGFEIDGAGRGIVPLGEPSGTPESVCGTQDWKDVKCYQASNPTEYARAQGAVLALIGCCSGCTAFKVSDSGQFLTNNHCTSTQAGVQSTELRTDYQLSGCASGSSGFTQSVFGSSLLRTDFTLDYTLMTTTGSTSIPCLQIDNRLAPVNERVYVVGHPNASVKKLSLESTAASNESGLCEVDASPYSGNDSTSDIGYYCDTIGGSSGSPVLSGVTNKVVAIHHFGGCLNSGVRMDRIYGQISGLLGACAGGGGGTCGNGTIDAGESCDGSNLNGQTCQSQGFAGGNLACNASCAFNTSGCTAACKASGQACTTNGECCSSSCKGKPGQKTCR